MNLRFKTFLLAWIGFAVTVIFLAIDGDVNILEFGVLGVITGLLIIAIVGPLLWLYFKTSYDEGMRPLRRKV
jgi:hypothetical protein